MYTYPKSAVACDILQGLTRTIAEGCNSTISG